MKVNMRCTLIMIYILFSAVSVSTSACGLDTAKNKTTLHGQISGATNMQIFLERLHNNNTSTSLAKVETDANGNFSMNIEPAVEEGIYALRIGAKQILLVFDGNEKSIKINANLGDIDRYQFDISGSEASVAYCGILKKLFNNQLTPQSIIQLIETTSNPIVAMQLSFQGLAPSEESLEVLKKSLERVKREKPNFEMLDLYAASIQGLESQLKSQKALEKIRVGEIAPEIVLPDPKGKNIALSSLRGKVVLIDFWASWCGPCRKANPKVVEIYHKYKNQGFTVFSVSLDGIDERTRMSMGNDEAQLKVQMDNQRQRWIDAIEKDKLEWPYHVSDLKKWDCAPAKEYGVSSIPRTFLIDREGKIVAINPVDLENAIRQTL